MGLFDFAREAGDKLRKSIGAGNDADAAELAKALRDNGVTIEGGRISVQGDKVSITGRASNHAEREKAVLILGNTAGVASVEDNITVDQTTAQQTSGSANGGSTFYTVKSGDTLSAIAQQHYGNANAYNDIFEANRPMLKDADSIYPGQTLRIPPRA